MLKNKNGITLIALIITIIVLLVLAGVVINLSMGENGIIGKAKIAVDKYKQVSENEQMLIAKYENKLDEYIVNSRDFIPIMLDENEHEIGTYNGKKLYQKSFIDRSIIITSTSRTWYDVIGSSELSGLDIDIGWIDSSNSFLKMDYIETGVKRETIRNISLYDGLSYNDIQFSKTKNLIQFVASGYEKTEDASNCHYFVTITIKYTKNN